MGTELSRSALLLSPTPTSSWWVYLIKDLSRIIDHALSGSWGSRLSVLPRLLKPRRRQYGRRVQGDRETLDHGQVDKVAMAIRGPHLEGGWPTGVGVAGRALRYWMATHWQTAMPSRSGECQNLGAVNSFEGKKGEVVNFKLISKNQTNNLIGVATNILFYFVKYMIWNIWYSYSFCIKKNLSHFCIYFCIEKVWF